MLTAYVAERLPLRLVAPVAAGIAWLADPRMTGGAARVCGRLFFAATLVAQFRMLDDLADRDHDAVHHPRRVLVRTRALGPFIVACGVVGLLNLVIAMSSARAFDATASLLALDVLFLIWYRVRSGRTMLSDHILLAKYPAFVWIVAMTSVVAFGSRLVLSMGVVYLAACVYEAYHDPVRPTPASRTVRAAEAVLLIVALAVLSIGAGS